MCSRFNNEGTPQQLSRRFGSWNWPQSLPATTRRPTDSVLCIDRQRGAWLAHWGLTVSWSKKPLINARIETLMEKGAFRPLLNGRCLTPATSYLEWRRDGQARRRNLISLKKGGLFAMAGLSDGDRLVILTQAATPDVAHIHHRMPVILPRATEATWLDQDVGLDQAISALVASGSDASGLLSAVEEESPDSLQLSLF